MGFAFRAQPILREIVYEILGGARARKIFSRMLTSVLSYVYIPKYPVPSEGAALRALKCGDDRDRGGVGTTIRTGRVG